MQQALEAVSNVSAEQQDLLAAELMDRGSGCWSSRRPGSHPESGPSWRRRSPPRSVASSPATPRWRRCTRSMAYRVRYLPKAVQQLDAILSLAPLLRNPSGTARRVGEAIRPGIE